MLNPFTYILNLFGATIRWIYGSIWRTIAHKKRFSFQEYLYGPKNSDDWFDENGHQFVNRLVAIVALVSLVILIHRLGI